VVYTEEQATRTIALIFLVIFPFQMEIIPEDDSPSDCVVRQFSITVAGARRPLPHTMLLFPAELTPYCSSAARRAQKPPLRSTGSDSLAEHCRQSD